MKKILAIPEDQGFGSSSNLLSMFSIFEMNQEEITVFIRPNLQHFFEQNGHKGRYILSGSNFIESLAEVLPNYDEVLCVNEPTAALLAMEMNKTVTYIDSLYWLWPEYVCPVITSRLQNSHVKDLDYTLYNESFLQERASRAAMAYKNADNLFIQMFSSVENYTKGESIEPFIHPLALENYHEGGEEIFVLLGGLPKQNNYNLILVDVLEKLSDKYDLRIACNSNNIKSNKLNIQTYEMSNLFNCIKRSKCVIALPGFSTLLECRAMGVPHLVLPAQNYGLNKYVENLNYKPNRIDWSDILGIKNDHSWDFFQRIENMLEVQHEIIVDRLVSQIEMNLEVLSHKNNLHHDAWELSKKMELSYKKFSDLFGCNTRNLMI